MKNAKKITSILILASMTIVMFAGCSSKKADTSAQTTTTQATTGQTGNKKFDPTVMKTRYEDALKSLVTAGTITQTQSDKVLEAVTKNVPQSGDKSDNKEQTKSTGTEKGQNGHKDNRLSSLVTAGTITQAQADAINQKVRENMKNSQSTQSTQN